jgi:hypothetical protein
MGFTPPSLTVSCIRVNRTQCRSSTIQCERDPPTADGSAGYRVTLDELVVCDLRHDTAAYRSGLREHHRVTHVNGQLVSGWDEYKAAAWGQARYTLGVSELCCAMLCCGAGLHRVGGVRTAAHGKRPTRVVRVGLVAVAHRCAPLLDIPEPLAAGLDARWIS